MRVENNELYESGSGSEQDLTDVVVVCEPNKAGPEFTVTDKRPSVYEAFEIVKKNKSQKAIKSWNQQHESLLDSWAEKAAIYKWMHVKSYQHFMWMNDIFTFPIIIVSSLSALGGVAIVSQSDHERTLTDQVVSYLSAFGNFAVATLTSLQKYKRYAELAERHRIAAVEYSKFYRDIKLELVLDPCERKIAIEYSKTMKAVYDKLLSNAPEIPNFVSDMVEKMKKNPDSLMFVHTNASIPFCL
jgi:hypothetical protein